MKNFKSVFVFILLFAVANIAKAQTAPGYYEGKWNILIKETPQGDVTLPVRFEIVDGKLKGFITNPEDQKEVEMASAEANGDDLVCAFSVAGYDLTMNMKKESDDVAKGKLMDMFEATATRVKP